MFRGKESKNSMELALTFLNCVGKMINDRLSSIDVGIKNEFEERKFRLSHSDF